MNAAAKPAQIKPAAQADEPAKGGIRTPHESAYPSGDTPKPHGDKLADAAEILLNEIGSVFAGLRQRSIAVRRYSEGIR